MPIEITPNLTEILSTQPMFSAVDGRKLTLSQVFDISKTNLGTVDYITDGSLLNDKSLLEDVDPNILFLEEPVLSVLEMLAVTEPDPVEKINLVEDEVKEKVMIAKFNRKSDFKFDKPLYSFTKDQPQFSIHYMIYNKLPENEVSEISVLQDNRFLTGMEYSLNVPEVSVVYNSKVRIANSNYTGLNYNSGDLIRSAIDTWEKDFILHLISQYDPNSINSLRILRPRIISSMEKRNEDYGYYSSDIRESDDGELFGAISKTPFFRTTDGELMSINDAVHGRQVRYVDHTDNISGGSLDNIPILNIAEEDLDFFHLIRRKKGLMADDYADEYLSQKELVRKLARPKTVPGLRVRALTRVEIDEPNYTGIFALKLNPAISNRPIKFIKKGVPIQTIPMEILGSRLSMYGDIEAPELDVNKNWSQVIYGSDSFNEISSLLVSKYLGMIEFLPEFLEEGSNAQKKSATMYLIDFANMWRESSRKWDGVRHAQFKETFRKIKDTVLFEEANSSKITLEDFVNALSRSNMGYCTKKFSKYFVEDSESVILIPSGDEDIVDLINHVYPYSDSIRNYDGIFLGRINEVAGKYMGSIVDKTVGRAIKKTGNFLSDIVASIRIPRLPKLPRLHLGSKISQKMDEVSSDVNERLEKSVFRKVEDLDEPFEYGTEEEKKFEPEVYQLRDFMARELTSLIEDVGYTRYDVAHSTLSRLSIKERSSAFNRLGFSNSKLFAIDDTSGLPQAVLNPYHYSMPHLLKALRTDRTPIYESLFAILELTVGEEPLLSEPRQDKYIDALADILTYGK